jgi:glycosyltransferase involved in cell wall biosynthesis
VTPAPSVSVVIPAYNLAPVIRETLRSVLEQTIPPDEIIVVDDGSTDATCDEVRAFIRQSSTALVRVIETPHAGAGETRNRGIRDARGDWVAFLDGDDLWERTKIEELKRTIGENPRATIVTHDNFERLRDGSVVHNQFHLHYDPKRPLLPQLYRVNFIATSCVAVRADVLKSSGGFDVALGATQDYDLWLRLARGGQLVFIRKPLGTYCQREGSISTRWLMRYRCVLSVAYRHAPYLVPVVGRRRAFLLRFRLVIIAHHYVLSQRPWANAREYCRVLVSAPAQLALAAVRPLGSAPAIV